MTAQETNAQQMAKERGIDPKKFRARLRREQSDIHTFGSWKVEIGSSKHQRMKQELDALIAETRHA